MQLTTVTAKDFMAKKVVTLTQDMDVIEAMNVLATHRISGAPVLDSQGKAVGILTERDCIEAVLTVSYHGEVGGGPVESYMSRDIQSVASTTGLLDIAESFVKSKYRRYPVVDDGRIVGIISRSDVLRAMLRLGWGSQ